MKRYLKSADPTRCRDSNISEGLDQLSWSWWTAMSTDFVAVDYVSTVFFFFYYFLLLFQMDPSLQERNIGYSLKTVKNVKINKTINIILSQGMSIYNYERCSSTG
jgi:hypothetical protein